jgi:hypothetical protein
MFRRILFAATCGVALAAVQAQCPYSQTLPPGLENQPVSGGSGIFQTPPGGAVVAQWAYASSLFQHQTPITIGDISVRLDGDQPLGAFSFPAVEVVLASGTAPVAQLGSNLPANLGQDAIVARPMTPWAGGPVAIGGAPSTRFVALGLTAPFVYNPSAGSPLVVQIRVCGATTPWAAGMGVVIQNPQTSRITLPGTCTPGVGGQPNPTTGTLLKLDYWAGGPQWESNGPASSLGAVGFTGGGPCAPLDVAACVGFPTVFELSSTSAGLGWDLAFMFAPPVPRSPATTTPGGQFVHVDLAHPTFSTLFGLNNLANPSIPFQTGTVQFIPTAPFPILTVQMLNLSPSHPDGFALSAPIRLTVQPPVQNLGFTTDDQFKTLNLATLGPVNAITAVPFFNQAWSEVHVSANGRLMFGAGSTSYTPSAMSWVADPPSVGYFSDFSPQAAGASVTATASGSVVTVSYNNVPHWASTAPTNFSISIDAVTGVITLSGLSTIVPVAGYDAIVGISAGFIGGAFDAGPTVFTVSGPHGPPAGPPGTVPAIYRFGPNGLITPGVNGIVFIPAGNNYTWTGF